MVSESQLRAQYKYDSVNTKKFCLKLNLKTDTDVIDRLDEMSSEEGGKQGYIKRLIREDIAMNP